MLTDRLLQALAQAKRFDRALAVMFLDLDGFKVVNDTYGHDAGDKFLIEMTARLGNCIRSGDTVARHGGDDFIIVLSEINGPDDAAVVAEKIVAALREPVPLEGHVVQVSVSVGIAVRPINGTEDAQALMKAAGGAMYAAKAAGRNGYRFSENESGKSGT